MSEEKPTFAQCFGGRDACCIAAVGNMAAMGRFETSFSTYGCAYLQNDEIVYRVTPEAEQLRTFVTESALHGMYPTGIMNDNWSTPVPTGMREEMAYQAKLRLAHKLQQAYPHAYFRLLQPFCNTAASNDAAPVLWDMVQALDGHFDNKELQLLEGTCQIAFDAKLLNRESLQALQHWLYKTKRQMENDPVLQTDLSRQFYGFCYRQKGKPIQAVVNAQPLLVWEQHDKASRSGYLTGPIIKETCWFENAAHIPDGRTKFRQTVLQLQGEAYFQMLQSIREFTSAVDSIQFQQALAQLEQTGAAHAIADFKQYGYRWNCLPME